MSAWQDCAENVPPPVVFVLFLSFSFPYLEPKFRMIWSVELWQENHVNTYGLLEIPWDQICPNLILTMMVCLLINCMFYPNFKTVNYASRAAYYIFPWIFAAAFLNLKQLWMMIQLWRVHAPAFNEFQFWPTIYPCVMWKRFTNKHSTHLTWSKVLSSWYHWHQFLFVHRKPRRNQNCLLWGIILRWAIPPWTPTAIKRDETKTTKSFA